MPLISSLFLIRQFSFSFLHSSRSSHLSSLSLISSSPLSSFYVDYRSRVDVVWRRALFTVVKVSLPSSPPPVYLRLVQRRLQQPPVVPIQSRRKSAVHRELLLAGGGKGGELQTLIFLQFLHCHERVVEVVTTPSHGLTLVAF